MRIGLATAPVPESLEHSLQNILDFMDQAASFDVDLLCFPEAYLPGMRGQHFSIPLCEQAELRDALDQVCKASASHELGVILPMEWPSEQGRYNLVQVISPEGKIMGRQCKTQLDPGEEGFMFPAGDGRFLKSTGSNSAWPSATRDGAIRKPCAGPPAGERRSSFIPNAQAAIRPDAPPRDGEILTGPITRWPWSAAALKTASISPA